MIDFVAMTEADYRAYLEQAVADYAAEHVRGGRWSAEEAEQRSRQEYRDLLPEGAATPNNVLYVLADAATHARVGMLWYALQERAGKQVAFIYDIAIDPEFRRRGYASQALRGLEQLVLARGVHEIRLHVFGHNHEARALYEALGYQPTNIVMAKTLKEPEE